MSNVRDLFATKDLPAKEYYDEDGLLSAVDYYIDLSDDVRMVFCYETNALLINDAYVGEITEEVAGELLKLVRSLGYTEVFPMTKGISS